MWQTVWRWLYPGLRLKRWIFTFSIGLLLVIFGLTTILNYQIFGVLEELFFRLLYEVTGRYNYTLLVGVGMIFMLAGLVLMGYAFRRLVQQILASIAPEGSGRVSQIIWERVRRDRGPRVVAIGGGTGLSALLRGLKTKTSHLTAIVTVADDGGSSGRLREEMDIIAPGDLRNCLVAMADKETQMEYIFQHRFGGTGELAGHSLGNLFLAALIEEYGDPVRALEAASEILNVRGQVVPASMEPLRLQATMTDGRIVEGESQIPREGGRIARLQIVPDTPVAVPAAIRAIEEADCIVFGPGSLYTSILPNLLVPEISAAIRRSSAMKVYVCNAMTQPGETDGYTVADHVQALINHAGPGIADYVLVNDGLPTEEVRERYAQQGSVPVAFDEAELEALGVKAVRSSLLREGQTVAHDPDRVADVLMRMYHAVKSELQSQLLDYYFERNL
ncbi:MAG: YvcK family protein [Veillonellaceae bacterium]|nr:YvcK family protein [Veillonellaceae bacterium]